MNIKIKDLRIKMELGSKAIELEVRDTKGNHQGDLIVGKKYVIWCEGRTRPSNGEKRTWKELRNWFNS